RFGCLLGFPAEAPGDETERQYAEDQHAPQRNTARTGLLDHLAHRTGRFARLARAGDRAKCRRGELELGKTLVAGHEARDRKRDGLRVGVAEGERERTLAFSDEDDLRRTPVEFERRRLAGGLAPRARAKAPVTADGAADIQRRGADLDALADQSMEGCGS